jgi:glycosyltransferase involved in cell wall biosynthesis
MSTEIFMNNSSIIINKAALHEPQYSFVSLHRMKTVCLCSFGTEEYSHSMEFLKHTALTYGEFDRVFLYSEKDIQGGVLPDFALQKKKHMFWAWKPYIILKTMEKVEEGDVVVYCDAGMVFTGSIRPHLRRLLRTHAIDDTILFRLGEYKARDYKNKYWCTRDCFVAMGCDEPPFHEAYQINAAIQVYKKTYKTMNFLDEYRGWCWTPEAMDEMHRCANYPGFQQHRHDQSVLTNLHVIHKPHICVARDPTQFGIRDECPAGFSGNPIIDHHRQRLQPFVRTTVITPTVGTHHLIKCIESVQAQTLMGVRHCIVVDGPEFLDRVKAMVQPFLHKKQIDIVVLPENTGSGGWNGHRIYGALPYLCNTEYVAYLDEDNWYEPDHLLDLMTLISERDLDWAFSLRRIVRQDGSFVTNDNCESLGSLCHTVVDTNDVLIDTSCMLLATPVAVGASTSWYTNVRGHDRVFTRRLLGDPTMKHGAVQKYSVNYRLGSGPVGPKEDFFVRGNETLGGWDFTRPVVYVFHFNPRATAAFLKTRRNTDRSYAMDEWQMTMLRDVAKEYTLVNGYAMESVIPPGSTVFVSMCLPQDIPLKTLSRRDLGRRIGFTAESPNIRHQAQWSKTFLEDHFDNVMTYWTPLLRDLGPGKTTLCLHNTHHLDFDNPLDVALLRDPFADGRSPRSVCMVLERREGLSGEYDINGVRLRCLDPLRDMYVQDLSDITVYGVGWDKYIEPRHPRIKVGHSLHRSQDPLASIQILEKYTFALIVENTNADGYVSEKLYDAFIAGTIPLYYGNNNATTTGIPKDMYIDLREYPTSSDLETWLGGLTDQDIHGMQRRIVDQRMDVLRGVSTKAFHTAFRRATTASK